MDKSPSELLPELPDELDLTAEERSKAWAGFKPIEKSKTMKNDVEVDPEDIVDFDDKPVKSKSNGKTKGKAEKSAKPAKTKAKPAKKEPEKAPAKKGKGKAEKGKKAAPAKAERKKDPDKLDAFGFRKSSIKSRAAAMYASKGGATLAEVKDAVGSVQFNLLTELEGKGFNIIKKQEDGVDKRKVTRYFVKVAK